MTAHLFTTWFTEYFKATVENYFSEKIPFKTALLIDNTPDRPRAPTEIYSEISVVFVLPNIPFILHPMDQGVILTLKSYYLRNPFHKAIADIDNNSSDVPGKESPFYMAFRTFVI